MKNLNFNKLNQDKNKFIPLMTSREMILLFLIGIISIIEFIIHVVIFAHLLMISGITSIILAFLFALICGHVSFNIWFSNGWSLIPYLYRKWFKNNSILMKYIAK